MRLVLASASPRRAELLAAAGFTLEIMAVDVDERVRSGERPIEYVRRLAFDKASEVLTRLTDDPTDAVLVIGADTAVVVGDEILGKPVDPLDAERMLRLLSGRAHVVLTGVCIRSRQSVADAVDETQVWVNPLSEEQIAWYVASGEGLDKAGAYAIQGLASRFIPKIEGSYSNVVGLPMATVDHLIRTVLVASSGLAKGRSSELF